MPLIPIDLPAGMMRNGTPYAARGRWVDGNLVRWHDEALRPIGGWQNRLTSTDDPIVLPVISGRVFRDAIDYITVLGNREALFFSNNSVHRIDSGDQVTDITPTGFHQGQSQPTKRTGYGTGVYGREAYGTRRTAARTDLSPVDRIAADMWGENVVFASVNHGPIYEYVNGAANATPLANAPSDVADVIVTDQRIVMAISNDPELRQVVWSDREDNTDWTPTPDNYADVRTLQGKGTLIGLYKVLNQILVLSENDAHVGRFIGAPFVYGFEKVGENCEPIWQTAVATTDRFAIWLSKRTFWIYDGTLKPLDCEVIDFLFDDINRDMVSKIHTVNVDAFSEIWWFYQSVESETDEVDSYVSYDYFRGHWQTGRLSRTVGIDIGTFEYVVMVKANGEVLNHELPTVQVEGEAYALSGPLELQNGQKNMALRYVFPDTEAFGSVELSFNTRQLPTDPDTLHGPFQYMNPTSTTGVLGREIRMRVRGLTSDWEVGTMRFDVQQIGGGLR